MFSVLKYLNGIAALQVETFVDIFGYFGCNIAICHIAIYSRTGEGMQYV